MKKSILFISAIIAAFSFNSCKDTDEFSEIQKENKVTLRATIEDDGQTRTNYVKKTGKFFWTNSDRYIKAYTTYDKFANFWMEEGGAGTANAAFSNNNVTGEVSKCAIYGVDYDPSLSGNELTIKTSGSIVYSNIT